MFSLNLKIFSYIFSYIYAFCNHKILAFLLFLKFLLAIFNNSPHSTYVSNFGIVSFDVIRPLRGIRDKHIFRVFNNFT